jgi:glycosyltransferase involved in cell wall biosynthesis
VFYDSVDHKALHMNGKPLVTAVITTHDRLQLLKRAIESVKNQTYPNIELIVVDDWSSDGTKEYCEYQDFKYIYIPREESKGGNYARNLGIQNANGEYIAFLDDDDYWLPEKTTKQVQLLQDKQCDLVYCGRKLERLKHDGSIEYQDTLPNAGNSGDLSKVILQTIVTTTSAIVVSKKVLDEVGLFDESLKFWQEYELTIRLAQVTPFYFVNEPLLVYRIDLADKNRLTNKFYAWRQSVRYIYNKHKLLYSNLSLKEKIFARRTYWFDGYERAVKNGLRIQYLKYQMALFLTNPSHYRLLKLR